MSNKNLEINDLANAFKVLSEPNRLKIICALGLECVPVNLLVEKTGLTQTNVSFHLRMMRELKLVKARREGKQVFYCLYDETLLKLLDELDHWLGTERE